MTLGLDSTSHLGHPTGEIVTAAHLNTHVRDNTLDLDRRTSPVASVVATDQGTASDTYVDLATVGPAVTVVIGATGKALVSTFSRLRNDTAGGASHMSYSYSGATVRNAGDDFSLTFNSAAAGAEVRMGGTFLDTGLTAGSTTITAKYRRGLGGTAYATGRYLQATPLGA